MKNDIRTKQRVPVVLPYRKPKNLNLRKVYRRHSRSLPRITSFIGTSSCKVLSAPSGSRRFICVPVEHPINTYTLWKPVQNVGIIILKKHYSNTTRSASTC
ncbi:VapE domain-containing protein [Paraprevotella clara]|uniref:VapE domain-containing protein n=1 Tax=Paraprevotella clara TaxID=454154 RepID=UPI003AB39E54